MKYRFSRQEDLESKKATVPKFAMDNPKSKERSR